MIPVIMVVNGTIVVDHVPQDMIGAKWGWG
jgi:hypothetical protein